MRYPLLALLALLACTGPVVETSETDTDTDTDTDADTDADLPALWGHQGEATTDGTTYAGTEDLYLIADEGAGADLCRIRRTITGTAVRDDCEQCEWAVDVVLTSPVAVVTDNCTPIGVDTADLSSLEGETRSQGFAREYIGHADVIMVFDGTRWAAVSFASWDDDSSEFDYDWDEGYLPL